MGQRVFREWLGRLFELLLFGFAGLDARSFILFDVRSIRSNGTRAPVGSLLRFFRNDLLHLFSRVDFVIVILIIARIQCVIAIRFVLILRLLVVRVVEFSIVNRLARACYGSGVRHFIATDAVQQCVTDSLHVFLGTEESAGDRGKRRRVFGFRESEIRSANRFGLRCQIFGSQAGFRSTPNAYRRSRTVSGTTLGGCRTS